MPVCNVEIVCKYGAGNVCRFNILIDGNKYSKVFNCDESAEVVKANAQEACRSNMLDLANWEEGWRQECIDL